MKIQTPAMNFKTFSFIPDGIHMDALFSATDNVTLVKRWNVDSGEEVNSLEIRSEEITTAVFSKSNTELITGHINKICVWNLVGNRITQCNTVTGDWGNVTSMGVTQSGDVIASGGADMVIRLWDASSLAPLASYPGHKCSIKSLRFYPQGDRLVSILRNGLRVWHTRKEDLCLTPSTNRLALTNVILSPNGEYVAASAGKDILVWDGRKGTFLTTYTGHSQVIKSLAFVQHLSLLASVSSSDGVFLWDLQGKGTHPKLLSGSKTMGPHNFINIVTNARGDKLAVIYDDRSTQFRYPFKLRVWDMETYGVDEPEIGIEIFQSKCHEGRRTRFVRFSSSEPLAVVHPFEPKYEHKVTVWDYRSDSLKEYDYNKDISSDLKPDYSVEESWIVSNRTGKRLLWLPESRRATFEGFDGYAAAQAVRGNIVAVGSKTGELSLLNMSSLESLR
jgi:WD40 repeat protein